ncbi:hypothetical protein BLNAU_8699 [Blattamonas nauphoetae]|uniref:Uncharacterized protein n=1 Tax=Blattamonas nauphoetae TaxID=2049346 RepID=A0ABQ9XXZ4_9EUKA|nr:hypothetical protein BLNAU_8699 [Blattamonas nauphoetae]
MVIVRKGISEWSGIIVAALTSKSSVLTIHTSCVVALAETGGKMCGRGVVRFLLDASLDSLLSSFSFLLALTSMSPRSILHFPSIQSPLSLSHSQQTASVPR